MAQQVPTWEHVVGEIGKGPSSKVQVTVGIRNKEPFVDLRTFFLTDDEKWVATKKGVRFHAESLPSFVKLLQEGDAMIDKQFAKVPKRDVKKNGKAKN